MASATHDDRFWANSLPGNLSGLPGYGVAILATISALILTFGLRYATDSPTFFLFYAAIFVSVWFCGRGPGWFAAGLAAAATIALLPVRFPMPAEHLAAISARIPTVMAFAFCVFTADWLSMRRHRTEAALRAARDRLEHTVLERTQALRVANEALSTEIEERRNIEAALRANEEFWRTIFETSNVPMGAATISGRDRMQNSAAQRLLGYSAEELNSLTIAGITHEDDRERTMPAFEQLRSGVLSDYHVVKRYRRKDGDVRWVDATVTRVPNPRGGEDLIFAIYPDITELKRAEAELRESNEALRAREEWWRRVFETSSVPIAVTDLNGRHIMVNRATERTLGYTLEELRSIRIHELTHEDDRSRTLPDFDALALGERKEYHVVKRYRCKDGSVKWLDASVTRVPDPQGGDDVAVGIVADITEQKRVEAELRASEERWRAMFEHAPVAIAMVRNDHRLIETNPGCHRLLGYTEEEFRELTPMDISFEGDRDETEMLLPKLIDGAIKAARAEKRYRARDGSPVWADATVFHVPATEGSPAFATAIVVDITERKRAEEALLRTQSELARAARVMIMGELTASIAHEVNQPLAAIVASGNACRRWLDMCPPNLERARESLGRMVADANRASEVITRIRALTRNALPEQVPLSINDIVHDVVLLIRRELDARQIDVRMELSQDVSTALGDKVQLQQVVLNLAINAVEALALVTGRRPVLTIRTATTTGELVVTVHDNGPGLGFADSERLFDAFFTTKPDGMGMGLSISRSIVEAHGGRLWASPAAHVGTEFHFTLPTAEVSER
jgi:PAS domain S-box-containing protein